MISDGVVGAWGKIWGRYRALGLGWLGNSGVGVNKVCRREYIASWCWRMCGDGLWNGGVVV